MVTKDGGSRWVLVLVLAFAVIVLLPVLGMIAMMLVGGSMMEGAGTMMGGMPRIGFLWMMVLAALIGVLIGYLIHSLRSS